MSGISKKIFLQMGFLPTNWEQFFQSIGFTISRDDGDAKWCLVDDQTSPDLWAPTYKIIHFGTKVPDKKLPVISINPQWLNDDIIKKMLTHSLLDDQSIKIDEVIGESISEMRTFKFGGHHKLGMYIDSMGVEAIAQEFDVLKIKAATLFLGHYLNYLRQAGYVKGLCEVQYGQAQNLFIVSLDIMAERFDQAYIDACMGSPIEGVNPKSLLRWVLHSTNLLDICFFKDDGKLRLTLFWEKGEKESSSSLMLTRIPNANLVRSSKANLKRPGAIPEAEESSPLPGDPFYVRPEDLQGDDKVIHDASIFVLSKIGDDPSKLTPEKIQEILSESPLAKNAEGLEQEILSKMQDRNTLGRLENELNEVEKNIDWNNRDTENLKNKMDPEFSELDGKELFRNIFQQEKITVSGLSAEEDGLKSKNSIVEKLKEKLSVINGDIDEDSWQKIESLFQEKMDQFVAKSGLDSENISKEDWVKFRNENIDEISQELESNFGIVNVKEMAADALGAASIFESSETAFNFMENLGESFSTLTNLTDDEKETMMVKSLDIVKRELGTFSNKIGLFPEDLNARQLGEFKMMVLPKIKEGVFNGEIPSEIENYFKNRNAEEKTLTTELKNKFKDKVSELKISGDQTLSGDINDEQAKGILVDSLKETLVEKFNFLNIDGEEKNAIREKVIQGLSGDLKLNIKESTDLVDGCIKRIEQWKDEEAAKEIIARNTASEPATPADSAKLKELEDENEYLKGKVASLELDLDERNLLAEKVKSDSLLNLEELENYKNISKIPPSVIDAQKREHLLNILKNKDYPTNFDSKLMAIAIAKEEKLTSLAQSMEKQLVTQQLDSKRKEVTLLNEVEKLRKENIDQKNQLGSLKAVGNTNVHEKNQQLKELEQKSRSEDLDKKRMAQENENLKRLVDTYKKKLDNAAQSITAQASSVAGSNQSMNKLVQDNRALEAVKNNLQTKMQSMITDMENSKARVSKISSELDASKKYVVVIEKQMDSLKNEIALLKRRGETSATAQMAQVEGKLKSEIQDLSKKLKDYEIKYKAIETKLKNTANTAQKTEKAAGPADQKRLDQLTEGNKKLMKDLDMAKNQATEEKKQTAKLKAENTKLQNDVNAMKKELEKLKGKAA